MNKKIVDLDLYLILYTKINPRRKEPEGREDRRGKGRLRERRRRKRGRGIDYLTLLIRRDFMDMPNEKSNYREVMWFAIFTETIVTMIL